MINESEISNNKLTTNLDFNNCTDNINIENYDLIIDKVNGGGIY